MNSFLKRVLLTGLIVAGVFSGILLFETNGEYAVKDTISPDSPAKPSYVIKDNISPDSPSKFTHFL